MSGRQFDSNEITPGGEVANFLVNFLAGIYGKIQRFSETPQRDALASKAITGYREQLERDTRDIDIWRSKKAISLDKLFVQPWFSLTNSSLLRGLDTALRCEESSNGGAKISASDFLGLQENAVVLGAPGSGKTTFLKAMLNSLVDGVDLHRKLPMFVSARHLGNTKKGLIRYLEDKFRSIPSAKEIIQELLEEGEVLVVLDGIDEISSQARCMEIVEEFASMATSFPKCRFIASCRSSSYDGGLDKFAEAEIAPFDHKMAGDFVNKWFGRNTADSKGCLDELRLRPDAADLASSPLLLSLICMYFSENGEVSSNKSELHLGALRGLLGRWDQDRQIVRPSCYRNVSRRKKESLFAFIAKKGLDEERDNSWGRYELEEIVEEYAGEYWNLGGQTIDGESILKDIENHHGILCFVGDDMMGFSHQSFADYYAARKIVDESMAIGLGWIGERVDEPRYSEVIQLAASLLDNADPVVEAVRAKAADSEDLFKQVALILRGFRPEVSGGSMITRCVSLLCSLYQVKPLARAFDEASNRATGRDENTAVRFLYEIADFALTQTGSWSHVAINPSSPEVRFMMDEAALIRAEAFSDVSMAKINYRRNSSAFIGTCIENDASIALRQVDLDLDESDVSGLHKPAHAFGGSLRKYLRRNLLLVSCINSGCTVRSTLYDKCVGPIQLPRVAMGL